MVRGARLQGPQQWRKVSCDVAEVLLPLLGTQQINVYSSEAVNAVLTVLCGLCPSVYSPADSLLKALLSSPPGLHSTRCVAGWVASVVIVMRLIISRCSATTVLTRLSELGLTMEYIPATDDATPTSTSSSACVSPPPPNTPPPAAAAASLITSANFSPMRRKLMTQLKSSLNDQIAKPINESCKGSEMKASAVPGESSNSSCAPVHSIDRPRPQPTTSDPLNVTAPPTVAPNTAIARSVIGI